MKTLFRKVSYRSSLVILTMVGTALAQPSGSGAPQQLPPGHPPIDGAPVQAPPLAEGDNQLPPGHPPIDPGAASPGPASQPMGSHGGMGMGSRDAIDDSSISRGSVQVLVRSPDGSAVGGGLATIETHRRSVSLGDSKRKSNAHVSDQGVANFSNLQIGSEYSYQVQVNHAGVSYSSGPFMLGESAGKRVSMKVYETKTDMDALPVGAQAFIFLSPRDEHVQVEELIRFSNIGTATWIPTKYFVKLPTGYKALRAEGEGNLKAEEVSGLGLRVSGFVKPGSEDFVFRYQIPYSGSDTLRIRIPLPARVGQLRVFTEGAGKVQARADGMPPFEPTESDNGQKMMFTEIISKPGDEQIAEASVLLSNVPTPGPGRWYAVGLTAAAIAIGAFAATRKSDDDKAEADLAKADLHRLRKALLDEIEGLERARQAGEIGPKTYEQDRRKLMDRLARVMSSQKS